MNVAFETQGVNFVAFTGYALIYDAAAVGEVTAAVNHDVLTTLSDKIDPSILEAANQAAATMTDIASNTVIS